MGPEEGGGGGILPPITNHVVSPTQGVGKQAKAEKAEKRFARNPMLEILEQTRHTLEKMERLRGQSDQHSESRSHLKPRSKSSTRHRPAMRPQDVRSSLTVFPSVGSSSNNLATLLRPLPHVGFTSAIDRHSFDEMRERRSKSFPEAVTYVPMDVWSGGTNSGTSPSASAATQHDQVNPFSATPPATQPVRHSSVQFNPSQDLLAPSTPRRTFDGVGVAFSHKASADPPITMLAGLPQKSNRRVASHRASAQNSLSYLSRLRQSSQSQEDNHLPALPDDNYTRATAPEPGAEFLDVDPLRRRARLLISVSHNPYPRIGPLSSDTLAERGAASDSSSVNGGVLRSAPRASWSVLIASGKSFSGPRSASMSGAVSDSTIFGLTQPLHRLEESIRSHDHSVQGGTPPDAESGTDNNSPLGVSLSWLIKFSDNFRLYPEMTTSEILDKFINKQFSTDGCAMVRSKSRFIPSGHIGPPHYFVSHHHGNKFKVLVDSLQEHFGMRNADDIFLYIDIFSVSQLPGFSRMELMEALEKAVQSVEGTLVVLDSEGHLLNRLWCLMEIWLTIKFKGHGALSFLTKDFSVRDLSPQIRQIDLVTSKCSESIDVAILMRSISEDAQVGGVADRKLATTSGPEFELVKEIIRLTLILGPSDFSSTINRFLQASGREPLPLMTEPCIFEPVDTTAMSVSESKIRDFWSKIGQSTETVAAKCAAGALADEAAVEGTGPVGRPLRKKRSNAAGFQGLALEMYMDWLSRPPSDDSYRWATIWGSKGSGKSTLAAALTASQAMPHAVYFCGMMDVTNAHPYCFLRSIAYQLALAFPNLRSWMAANMDLANVSSLVTDAEAVEILMSSVLSRIPKEDIPLKGVVILVDGLNEAAVFNRHIGCYDNQLLSTILSYLHKWPPFVRLVFTLPTPEEHPDLAKRIRLALKPAEIRINSLLSEGDQRANIRNMLMTIMSPRDASEAVGKLVHKSLGNFAYVALAMHMLQCQLAAASSKHERMSPSTKGMSTTNEEGPSASVLPKKLHLSVKELDYLPEGLYPLYAHCFTHVMRRVRSTAVAMHSGTKALLTVMSAYRGPLPLAILKSMGLAEFLHCLPGWGQLFSIVQAQVCIHDSSLLTWLQDASLSAEHFSDPVIGHQLLGEGLYKDATCASSAPSQYTLRNLMVHLCRGGGHDGLQLLELLVINFKFLERILAAGFGMDLLQDLLVYCPKDGSCPTAQEVTHWLQRDITFLHRYWRGTLQRALDQPPSSLIGRAAAALNTKPICSLMFKPTSWPLSRMELVGHRGKVRSACHSASGQLLASASDDGAILWDGVTGKALGVMAGASTFVVFSPCGNLLVTGSNIATFKVWDVKTCSLLHSVTGHTGLVTCASFSLPPLYEDGIDLPSTANPSHLHLATGSDDCTVLIWDCTATASSSAGPPVLLNVLDGHRAPLSCVSFSPKGGLLATGAMDKRVLLWERHAMCLGQNYCVMRHELLHDAPVSALSFSPNGKTIVTGTEAGEVLLWNCKTRKRAYLAGLTPPKQMHVRSCSFSPDATLLVTAHGSVFSPTSNLRVWDTSTGDVISETDMAYGSINHAVHTPDGLSLAVASNDTLLRLLDANLLSGSSVGDATHEASSGRAMTHRASGGNRTDNQVVNIYISPKDDLVVCMTRDRQLQVWDVTGSRAEVTRMQARVLPGNVYCHMLSVLIIFSSQKGLYQVWDVRTGEHIPPKSIEFSRGWMRLKESGLSWLECPQLRPNLCDLTHLGTLKDAWGELEPVTIVPKFGLPKAVVRLSRDQTVVGEIFSTGPITALSCVDSLVAISIEGGEMLFYDVMGNMKPTQSKKVDDGLSKLAEAAAAIAARKAASAQLSAEQSLIDVVNGGDEGATPQEPSVMKPKFEVGTKVTLVGLRVPDKRVDMYGNKGAPSQKPFTKAEEEPC